MSFGSLGLCDELLKTVIEQGYKTPSPVQVAAIPAVLSQQDVMAVAQTGTGKTAGFTLPMVQLLFGGPRAKAQCVRALVVTPTRELAAQVACSVQNYSRHLNISCAAAFGGVRIEPQINELQAGLDVLVTTPGRLLDLYNQQAILFEQLEILVLDEADRMLDMGFIDDIRLIQTLLPNKRQTLMFSATFSTKIKLLAQGMLDNPKMIEIVATHDSIDTIKQVMHPVDNASKSAALIHLIKKHKWHQLLVFSGTKHGADSLVLELEKAGVSAVSIHANRTQHARTAALDGFRNGKIMALVATDVASRGLDVNQLPCVVNFDLPYVAEDYVHRIGRTGRAGNSGLAVSLFCADESKRLTAIEHLVGRKFKLEVIPGFAPSLNTPTSSSEDDEYGNFEADPKPRHKGQSQGRGRRGGR
jgi:ATP-dependent RNA helicase RhlE